MSESIEFPATVARVKTLVDGGIRVELDLPETEIMTAAQLMECKRAGAALKVTVQALINTEKTEDASMEARPKRKPEWTAPEGPRHSITDREGAQ